MHVLEVKATEVVYMVAHVYGQVFGEIGMMITSSSSAFAVMGEHM